MDKNLPLKRFSLCSSSECKYCEWNVETAVTKTHYCLFYPDYATKNIRKYYDKKFLESKVLKQ